MNPSDAKIRYHFACTLPKSSAATEKMIAYGAIRGKGTTYKFGAGLPGKTFILTDSGATIATAMTYTFQWTDFANPEVPLLAEIVVALNTYWAATSTNAPVASSGAFGELIVTGYATGTTQTLAVGAGTANEILGFPKMGFSVVNGTGVTLTLPAETAYPSTESLYLPPRVRMHTLTVASGVLVQSETVTVTWTPSTRVLLLADSSNGARACHFVVDFDLLY
jgi:hypothetical protein